MADNPTSVRLTPESFRARLEALLERAAGTDEGLVVAGVLEYFRKRRDDVASSREGVGSRPDPPPASPAPRRHR